MGLKNKTKAQSAIEYLMTYGWMLIVLAIIGAAIYAVIGSQCLESTQGLSTSDVSVDNFGLDSDQNLSLEVSNNINREVEIQEYNINISGNDAVFPSEDIEGDSTIQPGQTTAAKLPSFDEGDQCITIDVRINYVDSTLGNQTISGTIVATIGEDFDVPTSPTDFTVTEITQS